MHSKLSPRDTNSSFFFTKQNELFAFRQNETSLTLHMLHIVEICFNCGKDSNLV